MLYPPHLTHAQLEQSGRFDLRPLTFEHQRHHLQHVPITLTHQNPVFLHPSLTNRTFLPAEERTLLPADDRTCSSPSPPASPRVMIPRRSGSGKPGRAFGPPPKYPAAPAV